MIIAFYRKHGVNSLAGVFPNDQAYIRVIHVLENHALQNDMELDSIETKDNLNGVLLKLGVRI